MRATVEKLRICVISSDELSGEVMEAALRACGHLTVNASVGFDPAPGALWQIEVDVVLIDAGRASARALELVHELGERNPDLKMLPLGLENREQTVLFLEAGAAGYAMKDDSLETVCRTIAAVAAGRPPCSERVLAMVFQRIAELARRARRGASLAEAAELSPRERQVLTLLAAGLRNKEIARRLGIALSTAGHHVQRVLDKLGAGRRRDAIRRACELGWIDPPWIDPPEIHASPFPGGRPSSMDLPSV